VEKPQSVTQPSSVTRPTVPTRAPVTTARRTGRWVPSHRNAPSTTSAEPRYSGKWGTVWFITPPMEKARNARSTR
jgi:hypothetical protein